MVLVTFLVAALRYGFNMGWVWMQESYVWMHGTIFMVAVGYTLLHEGHVRVDIFYRPASDRYKALVDLGGTLFLLFPSIAIIFWVALPYLILSWQRLEESREAGGLPGLFLWKTTMLMFCVLLALQGLAIVVRSTLVLTGHREVWREEEKGDIF
ncbi:MAG: TRAP transporter small permease subunit [Acidimicrobiia bacterium]